MKRTLPEAGASPENGACRRQRSVKWDEANLEENDKLKAELNPSKIEEPKTPYHGLLDSDEELSLGENGVTPLTLEDNEALQQLATERQNGTSTASGREEDRACSQLGWSDSERGEQSSGAISISLSSICPGDECDSNPEDPQQQQEKKRRFESRRRRHYNMKDALKRGKELLSEQPEGTIDASRGSPPRRPELTNGAPSSNGQT